MGADSRRFRVALLIETSNRYGRDLEHENCRLLRIAPRARVESNVVLERKRHLTAHATTSRLLKNALF